MATRMAKAAFDARAEPSAGTGTTTPDISVACWMATAAIDVGCASIPNACHEGS